MMMETAYHAALAPHQKRVPKLDDLLIREPRKKMRPEEIRHALELWLGKGPPH